MANNPLQKYFRQPKIFIGVPSKGVYTKPGVLTGEIENMPVYGMTGMDEIIIKTPDALLNGDAVVKVIESCCPNIKDAWELSNIDLDAIMAAIRIATYGNSITISHTCVHCESDNEYELELSKLIEHFSHVMYDNKVVLKEVVIQLRPLTYRQVTDFSLRNFQLQQQLQQTNSIEDETQRKTKTAELYTGFAVLQTEVYSAGIESVQVSGTLVEERMYIDEWLSNTETTVFDKIKEKIDENRETWKTPAQTATCQNCTKENTLNIDLDYANFLATA
jgi:hypothetical protein